MKTRKRLFALIAIAALTMTLLGLTACGGGSSNQEDIDAIDAQCSHEVSNYRPLSAPVKDSMGYGTHIKSEGYSIETCSFASTQPEGRIYNMSGKVSYYCDTTADGMTNYGPFEWRGQCAVDDNHQVSITSFTVDGCTKR